MQVALIEQHGGTGADRLYGGADNDALHGDAGADTLYGGSGKDELFGGEDDDTLYGENDDDILHGDAGNDTLDGGDGNDVLYGGTGIDRLFGGAGNDVIYTDGTDEIDGGDGIDTVRLESFAAGTVIDLARIATHWLNIEKVELGNGNNVVVGNSRVATITSGDGNDIITGGDGNDVINGGAGNDRLDGGLGADKLVGGTGNDIYVVDNAGDIVSEIGGDGTDTVLSSLSFSLSDTARVFGQVENLTLTGSASINATGNELVNRLIGNTGSNILDGGAGADTMEGGAGDDTYMVDNVGDVVVEAAAAGNDTVIASVSFLLSENVENLTLTGFAALSGTGNALDNRITGNDGANTLSAGAGNDRIDGNLGNDLLTGGAGRDMFVFDTKLNAKTNLDRITDFNVKDDTIELENAIFTRLKKTGVLAKTSLAVNALGKALDKDDFIVYNSKTGALSYDADGNGKAAAIQFATLQKGLALTSLDFMVV